MARASLLTFVLSFATVLMTGFSAHAVTVGFDAGSEFNAAEIRGAVNETCMDRFNNRVFRTVYCSDYTLDPVEAAYLTTSEPIAADHVALTATHADGKSKSKTAGYDFSKMRSSNRFNLWIKTLTQSPLLDVGVNHISYAFSKKGAAVATGSFDVNVAEGATRYCPTGNVFDVPNCDLDVCDQYFYENNYCQ